MIASMNIAGLLGITPGTRQEAVEGLFLTTERHPLAYWLQLWIAAGIAHLGLVLNSTAVVIGAMLVSPLMTPIVQVGMSFAIGNLFLTMRALIRVVMSIVFVVLFAAVITKTLPFHEVTAEILARTQPTALDLVVAFFCGLAAAFTISKGSRDTVTAAAGTAIAIALVPPLCVVGFGIGVGSMEIVWGATLLFTANFAAIILVSDVYFLVTGFANIEHFKMEEKVLGERDASSLLFRVARRIKLPRNVSRWRMFRIFLPSLFVLSVFFPLSKALERVTWEVHVKTGINQILADVEKNNQVLARYQTVTHDSVAVQLTMLGEPGSDEELAKNLTSKLAALSGVEPKVSILVVPSAKYMNDKLQSAWTNSSLTAAKLGRKLPFMPTPEEAVANISPTLLRDSLRLSLEKTLAWMRENDHDGDWISWSMVLGKDATEIVIQRLADSDLSAETRAFMSGALQKETGFKVSIQEKRIARTLFEGNEETAFVKIRKTIEAEIRDALATPSLKIAVLMPRQDDMTATNQKRSWNRMKKLIMPFLASLVPPESLDTEESGETWIVQLRIKKQKKTPAAAENTVPKTIF